MKKNTKHIEIVSSSISSLSSMSEESRVAIRDALLRHYSDVRITLVDTVSDLKALARRKPDLVFLGMKFVPLNVSLGIDDTEKIWLSEYLEQHDIAHTGSRSIAHELELNKQLAKQCVADAGLATARFFVAKQDQALASDNIKLSFPVFIKPPNRGGGLGIDSASVARTFDELATKVASIAARYGSDALVEEYLPGREFSVAILRNQYDDGFSSMPIELVAEPDVRGSRLLSQAVKCSNNEVVLEVTEPVCRAAITTLALDVFRALGARDYGRIDIRMDEAGVPHFLEANLIPSLIQGYGSFPKACMLNQNIDFESMILRIVELGLARNIKTPELLTQRLLNQLIPAVLDTQPIY